MPSRVGSLSDILTNILAQLERTRGKKVTKKREKMRSAGGIPFTLTPHVNTLLHTHANPVYIYKCGCFFLTASTFKFLPLKLDLISPLVM